MDNNKIEQNKNEHIGIGKNREKSPRRAQETDIDSETHLFSH